MVVARGVQVQFEEPPRVGPVEEREALRNLDGREAADARFGRTAQPGELLDLPNDLPGIARLLRRGGRGHDEHREQNDGQGQGRNSRSGSNPLMRH